MKRACVVVITHSGRSHLERLAPTLVVGPQDSIALVDNASADGSADFFKSAFPSATIFKFEENLGFAKGNNVAIEWALGQGFKYVVLLNDDTCIVDSRWLDEAVLAAERELSVGFVGFALSNTPEPSNQRAVETQEVARVDGWGMVVKTDVLREVGMFDETYFAYAEESDLQARAIKAGYELRKISIPIFHAGGGSFGRQPERRVYLRARNWLRYSIKQESPPQVAMRLLQIATFSLVPPRLAPEAIKEAVNMFDCGSRYRTVAIFGRALAWNAKHFSETRSIRRTEAERCRLASTLLKQRLERERTGDPT